MSISVFGLSVFAEEDAQNFENEIVAAGGNVTATGNGIEEDVTFSYDTDASCLWWGLCGSTISTTYDGLYELNGYYSDMCWEYYDDGSLRLYGEGDMKDYSVSNLPYYVKNYKSNIKKVPL